MSDWSTEKKVDTIIRAWQIKEAKEKEDREEARKLAEAKLLENKADITAKKPDAPAFEFHMPEIHMPAAVNKALDKLKQKIHW